ncbi:PREDICTED: inhibitor of carbonic anhydrase-like, partial [Hipposideros armiger]|uniref:Inhibitor of carbonic anhydrase-like n=1 Tax=Hipposideros armiger TaxID=186990 RepID=A0A8B7QJD9_HIPAR
MQPILDLVFDLFYQQRKVGAEKGLCLAVPGKTVRWCTVSNQEASKCASFRDSMKKVLPETGPLVACVKRTSHLECIKAIAANEADAVTLDAGLIFEAGLTSYNLKPVVAENYGSKDTVANFFAGSCVPCADQTAFPKLCQLCAGQGTDKCACSNNEPYFGSSGAFKCLQDGVGDVGFVRHTTVLENLAQQADRDQYELLCTDNTRKPVDKYEECHLSSVPSNAVVARTVGGKEDLIWELLNQAQENFGKGKPAGFQLFGSPHGKDLLFTDAAHGFLRVPPKMDAKLYLGYKDFAATQHLRGGAEDPQRVQWCAVGPDERSKCDNWSAVSGGTLRCTSEETVEDCIAAIAKGEADAMSLDGGFIYTAGKCGLVPVLAENYLSGDGNEQLGSKCVNTPVEGYYVVAVVKKSDADLTWNSLRGKKSCHTSVGTSAGWHIPMGLIFNQTGSCKLDEFFSQSCAPGSDPESSLCALCSGSSGSTPAHVCAAQSRERYYGSSGALRCLVEKGDVAFVKHPTVLQNTDGKNPEDWAKNLKKDDFQLLCLDGTRKPVTEAENCHLGRAPSHAVVSREDKADFVRRMLFNQQ